MLTGASGLCNSTGLTCTAASFLKVTRMSRILVAVSSPWASERMVEPLTGLARRLGAEVLVVHVSRPSGGQMREQEQADGEAAISLLRRELETRSVPVQTLLLFS